MHSRYNSFIHTILTNEELTVLATRIMTEVRNNLEGDSFLEDQCTVAEKKVDQIGKLKGRSKKNTYTKLIRKDDKSRDAIYDAIIRTITNDIAMAEFEPEQAKKAIKIQDILDLNLVNTKAGYTAETAQMNTLIGAVKEPGNVPFITGSSVEVYFKRLESIQQHFEALQDQKNSLEAVALVGEVKTEVKELVYRLDALLSYLDVKARDYDTFEEVAKKVGEIISEIVAVAKARETRKQSEKELVTE